MPLTQKLSLCLSMLLNPMDYMLHLVLYNYRYYPFFQGVFDETDNILKYHEIRKMLDDKYDFPPDTNYQNIIDILSLPYYLDGVIIDEINNIITEKFDMTPYCESDYFYEFPFLY